MGSDVDPNEKLRPIPTREERPSWPQTEPWDPRAGEAFPMPVSDPGVETRYTISPHRSDSGYGRLRNQRIGCLSPRRRTGEYIRFLSEYYQRKA